MNHESTTLAAVQWLHACLPRRLDAAQAEWLQTQLDHLSHSADASTLDIAFGMAPRRFGKMVLALTSAELAEADQAIAGWDPSRWNLSDAARVLFLCSLAPGGKPFAQRFRALCQSADMAELAALYRGLPLYPQPDQLLDQVGEGLRSNIRAVFEAIAQHSPFPKTHFDQHRWNHMVLKALFIDSPLAPIQGLDERANSELARIMCDFAHERWAAGRRVPHMIWRCVGPFAQGAMIEDMARVLREGDETERAAAALALSACPDAGAASLLRQVPELAQRIAANQLNWRALS